MEATTEAAAAVTETNTETVATEEVTQEVTEEVEEDLSTFGGKVAMKFDLSAHESENPVRLWIPSAQSDDYQEISNVEITVNGEDTGYEVNKDVHGNEIIYIEWAPDDNERTATYSFDVQRNEVTRPVYEPEEEFDPAEFEEYLSGSELLVIDGETKELADEITAGKETVEEKSKAIYDWIFENMVRNDDVIGCGLGDVSSTMVSLDGKCTDIGSMNIALSRAAGIPAREIFGIRLNKDPEANITKSQHCWVEYYQPGTGWVSTDGADVLRGVLYQELDKDSAEAKELYDYYWGNLDAVRVGLTTGRDLTLVPEQNTPKLNQFGYPYAEVDGEPLNFYDPDNFMYEITFTRANQ